MEQRALPSCLLSRCAALMPLASCMVPICIVSRAMVCTGQVQKERQIKTQAVKRTFVLLLQGCPGFVDDKDNLWASTSFSLAEEWEHMHWSCIWCSCKASPDFKMGCPVSEHLALAEGIACRQQAGKPTAGAQRLTSILLPLPCAAGVHLTSHRKAHHHCSGNPGIL